MIRDDPDADYVDRAKLELVAKIAGYVASGLADRYDPDDVATMAVEIAERILSKVRL